MIYNGKDIQVYHNGNPVGPINRFPVDASVSSGLLSGISFDAVVVSYPSSTQEVYVFKTGGVSGTTVSTVTVDYTDSTKNNLSSVVKT